MKKIFAIGSAGFVIAIVIVIAASAFLYAFSGGITGKTKKDTNLGCSCHGNNPVTEVTVSIGGPDTVITGQTAVYSLTITKLSKNGAGLDIAVRGGTLSSASNNTHVLSGELTHSSNIPMTNGTVTVQFNYTAPDSSGIDTIWATGIATNSDNTTSGDNWNWAPSKRVVISNPIGIRIISESVPDKYELGQNYPNPFNPNTNIKFSVPQASFVKLVVFDITGRAVETLEYGNLNPGTYKVNWDANRFASGMYFYTLQAGTFTETKKMILIK